MGIVNFKRKKIIESDYMSSLENMFFNSETYKIDYEKIDVNSLLYDSIYEEKVRKEDINYLYVLDEMMLLKNDCNSDVLSNISKVEYLIINYFSKNCHKTVEHKKLVAYTVQKLCKVSFESLALAQQMYSMNDYQQTKYQFSNLALPENMEEFFERTHALVKKMSDLFV